MNHGQNFKFGADVRIANSTELFITHDLGQVTPTITKIAFKYKQNDFALWVNGVEVETDTNTNVPTGLNELAFTRGGSVHPFQGKVKCVAVFKEALTDAQLTALTT